MKWWLTADHHFRHFNIIEYTKRPFKSLEDMDGELIRRWNERVKEEDRVLYLGDFAFGDPEEYIEQLNGDIVFLKGSHDREIKTILRSCVIKYGGVDFHCSHVPESKFKFNLCGHVHEKWKIKRAGPKVIVNVGVDQWDFYPIDIEEILKYLAKEGVRVGKEVEE